MIIQHQDNGKIALMIDRCNNAIGHHHHHISIRTEATTSSLIVEIITETGPLRETTISLASDKVTINSTIREDTIDRHLLTATDINNTITATNRETNLTITIPMTDKITIIEAATEEVRHKEACNRFEERLGMIRAGIELVREPKNR